MDDDKWFVAWFAICGVAALTVVGVAIWAVITVVNEVTR